MLKQKIERDDDSKKSITLLDAALDAAMTGSLAQQGADLVGGIVDFNLEHRVSRLEFSARCFSSLDSVKLRLEMAVDDRHEPFGGGAVGPGHFLRRWFLN